MSKMIYQDGPLPDPSPHHPVQFDDIARLLHDAKRRGQAMADEVWEEATRRYYTEPKFSAQVKMAVGVLQSHLTNDVEGGDLTIAAAVAMVVAERVDHRQQMEHVLDALQQSEIAIRTKALERGIDPEKALSPTGEPLLAPVLAAQAQMLDLLAQLGREDQERRDRELIARHLRAAASAQNIEDWPGYLLDVAAGHAAGTSWYRP